MDIPSLIVNEEHLRIVSLNLQPNQPTIPQLPIYTNELVYNY